MTDLLIDPSGPYAHAPNSVQRIMYMVAAALTPATLFNAWVFGWPAVWLFLVTVAAALAAEALCLILAGKPLRPSILDGSAVLTGWLLALCLPPYAPWWIGVVGSGIGIIVGKHVFGGLGQNPFNPAMVARVALLISFPVPMTLYNSPAPLGTSASPGLFDSLGLTFTGSGIPDALSAATPLGFIKTGLSLGIPVDESLARSAGSIDLATGMVPGSMGETSALLLAAGGVFLIWKRIITWHIPVALMGSVMLLGTLSHLMDPGRFADGVFHLLAGATVMGAFFIATDPVTSPVTRGGQIVFGAGCGALTWIIRSFAGYPEGLAFAILLMNALTPLIDRTMRPRVHGRTRWGDPLSINQSR